MKHLALLFALFATPALADLNRAVDEHILPGYRDFAEASAGLAEATKTACADDTVKAVYQTAFDAWMEVSHLRLGPVEDDGRIVIIAFWPDERSATPKALKGLIADEDPIIETPEGVARLSVAARGLYALDYLLYDPGFDREPYSCALISALATDLSGLADAVLDDWQDGYAALLRDAGGEGNTTYLSAREGKQALFTVLTSGLEFTAEQRLGRPLGTYERPRPTRAEAWRAGRSERNVMLSLDALQDLKDTLLDKPTPDTDAAFARAIEQAEALDDPIFAGVEDPQKRFKIEALQQSVQTLRQTLILEAGAALGVAPGFNATDGD